MTNKEDARLIAQGLNILLDGYWKIFDTTGRWVEQEITAEVAMGRIKATFDLIELTVPPPPKGNVACDGLMFGEEP